MLVCYMQLGSLSAWTEQSQGLGLYFPRSVNTIWKCPLKQIRNFPGLGNVREQYLKFRLSRQLKLALGVILICIHPVLGFFTDNVIRMLEGSGGFVMEVSPAKSYLLRR